MNSLNRLLLSVICVFFIYSTALGAGPQGLVVLTDGWGSCYSTTPPWVRKHPKNSILYQQFTARFKDVGFPTNGPALLSTCFDQAGALLGVYRHQGEEQYLKFKDEHEFYHYAFEQFRDEKIFWIGFSHGGTLSLKSIAMLSYWSAAFEVKALHTIDPIGWDCQFHTYMRDFVTRDFACERFPVLDFELPWVREHLDQNQALWTNYYQKDFMWLHSTPSPWAHKNRRVRAFFLIAHINMIKKQKLWAPIQDSLKAFLRGVPSP